MGELVGLGLRGIGKSAINIDLVPMVVEQARAADRRKPFLVAAAAALLLGVGAWATFQNMAAAAATEEARTMEDQRASLAPLKAEIDQLLKREQTLRNISNSYTNLETAHVYWIELIMEIRSAFASDAVWLVDLEPLHGYDPLASAVKAPGAKAGTRNPSGKSVIKPDFATAAYGNSSLVDIKVEQAAPQGRPAGRQQQQAAPQAEGVRANAIRIKGFWRVTPKRQDVVSELLKTLREKSSSFKFTVKNASGEDVLLTDDKLLDITVDGQPGELGLPFEITLPLAREVLIK
jgi:hypothetical protein